MLLDFDSRTKFLRNSRILIRWICYAIDFWVFNFSGKDDMKMKKNMRKLKEDAREKPQVRNRYRN